MTRSRRFENSFWETDFNGTLGFDSLCKHIRDGQKTCRDLDEFFKKRAKAEQSYSKSLLILAKSADGREETGGLGSSWQELKAQTEKLAHFHEHASSEYSRLADELSKFAEDLKQVTKPIEEKVKESQRVKKNAYNKMTDLQKTYHSKCREMTQHDNQLSVANQSVTLSTKEVEKIKSKVEKSKEAMEQSDIAYKQVVEVLERARSSWEKEMEEACEQFQKQEEERISFLRNQLWKCTNVDSQLCVDWDESCERVRICLEKCDIENDIQEFIDNNSTGCTRPAPILYENYFGEKSNGKSEDIRSSPKARGKHQHPHLPPLPEQASQEFTNTAVYSYAAVSSDALYSSVEPEQKYKVTKSFIPTGTSGILLRRGDVVKQAGPETKSGLIKVQLEGNVGFVPVENLQAI